MPLKNGTELLAAIDGSFGLDAVMGAIKTHSRKNESVEALLLAEYEAPTAKTGAWSLKWKSAEMLVKTKLPKELAKISEDTKKKNGYMPHRAAQMQGYFARTHHVQGHVRRPKCPA